MTKYLEALTHVGQIETWAQAPSVIFNLKNEFNLSLLAVLSPDEIETGKYNNAQVLDEMLAIMPPQIIILMLTQVTPTNQPIDVYKSDDTIVLAYKPINN